MYTKPTKYKYRGHRFDGNIPLLSAQNDALTSPTDTYLYKSIVNKPPLLDAPNSMLQYYNSNVNIVTPQSQQPTGNAGTSLSSDTGIDKPADNSGNNGSNNNNWFTQGMDAVNQVSPYFYITNTADQWGANAAQRASKGKGLWTNLYNSTVNEAVESGATSEAAAKAGSEAVASKAGSIAGGAATAIQGITEAYQGWNQDLSGDPFSKEDARMAVWNTASDNPLLYNPNVSAWSNLANNYKDYVDSLDKVGFNSNTQSMRSLGREWENQKMIDLNKSDLDKSIGRQILDYNVATGKGALIGLAAGGPWGALAGAIVGSGLDLFNKYKANKNKNKIFATAKEADQRMYQQALNRRDIITEMNNRRDMINYSALGGKLFADGGTMLNKFETGGSHEENPYGGILQGVAPDGQPNLVEQGETKWNDENYIFSKRLKINKQLAREYNLPKEFIGKSFADATSKFDEKFKEHENDALSIATQNAILARASEAQEALRANERMKQLNKQMANLTPEEQQNLLMQMQQQPMETQQMQYPMGSENMQGGIPQGYAEGGHLFAGPFSFATFPRRLQYTSAIPNQQSFFDYVDQLQKQDPDNWAWRLNRNLNPNNGFTLFNQNVPTATALKEVPEGLQDPIVITPTPEENVQVANAAVDWAALSKNKPTYGNWTKDTPQPENAHEQMFAKALNEYWQKRYDDAKTSEDYKKIADDYNDYQNLYAEIAQHAGDEEWVKSDDGKKAIKDLQGKWRTFSHNSNSRGLNQYVTKDMMKDIFQTVNKNTNSEPDDLKNGVIVDPDGLWGVQTAARYMGITDPELLKKLEAVGITQGKYAPGAWFNRLSYAEPTPQNADNSQTPSEEKKEDTSTEGIRETPELLPTWMRGVGALLPFAFLNAKSDYSNADMIRAPKIGFNPIADYLKRYRPLDKQYHLNTANASQQNLRNNIVNLSGGNRAAAVNNLMLADLQAQNALGDLYRRAEEYNADQRAKVAAQNADVNKFNSNGFFGADQWNANAEFQARQAQAQMRHNIDVMTAQAKGANLTQGINNLIGLGDENARLNMIASNPALAAYIGENFGVKYKTPKTTTEAITGRNGGYLTIKKRK